LNSERTGTASASTANRTTGRFRKFTKPVSTSRSGGVSNADLEHDSVEVVQQAKAPNQIVSNQTTRTMPHSIKGGSSVTDEMPMMEDEVVFLSTEKVFNCTSKKPIETSTSFPESHLNSQNNLRTFLKKDRPKLKVLSNFRQLNRDLT
jgi:hypothetical protein